MHLPRQAIGDAVTTVWPVLMRDLERIAEARTEDDYKALEDDVARLTTRLESFAIRTRKRAQQSRAVERHDPRAQRRDREAQTPSVDHVDDVVVDTTWSTSSGPRRAIIMPDGPTTGAGPLRARGPDITAGASIPNGCPPRGGSF
jgi:hypothetical protein